MQMTTHAGCLEALKEFSAGGAEAARRPRTRKGRGKEQGPRALLPLPAPGTLPLPVHLQPLHLLTGVAAVGADAAPEWRDYGLMGMNLPVAPTTDMTRDGRLSAAADRNGAVHIFDADSDWLHGEIGGFGAPVCAVAFSFDSRLLLTAWAGNVAAFDACSVDDAGRCTLARVGRFAMPFHGDPSHLTAGAAGTRFAVGTRDGEVVLCDTDACLNVTVAHVRGVAVTRVSLTRDDSVLFARYDGGQGFHLNADACIAAVQEHIARGQAEARGGL